MTGAEVTECAFGWWWVFPLAMIALCVFMARRRKGTVGPCCFPGSTEDASRRGVGESAREILDRRYASGEIGREEYEEKKMDLEKA